MTTAARRLALLFIVLCGLLLMPSWLVSQARSPREWDASPGDGAGAAGQDVASEPRAPILIVRGRDSAFSGFYPEILKAEGLNLFATEPAAELSAASLEHRRVLLLATSEVNVSVLAPLEAWVRRGGLLIAMRPEAQLLPLAGLGDAGDGVIEDGDVLADPAQEATRGIVRGPLQVHGEIRLYRPRLADAAGDAAVTVAHLYREDAATPLPNPAVTQRRLGRGQVVVFAYDLARSVVLTRQGNPLWSGEKRDGSPPRRPSDLFFPGYLKVDRIGVPQADEQQRLLANLILTAASAPLPRFWYLPDGRRAVIVMTGDDHATRSGTEALFAKLAAMSPPGCRLKAWECPRATAYFTPGKAFPPELAATYEKLGFEFGAHVDTGCRNQDDTTLSRNVGGQLQAFRAKYESLPIQATHRIHCLVWNGWTTLPEIERRNGVRLDLNYYHWPPRWIGGRPGFLTGSGFPMPFMAEDGRVLDIYQAGSQLVNESGVPQREGVAFMLQRALGPEQFFGAFATHYDYSDPFAEIVIDVAQQYDVPLITAQQMLSWTDGRNGSRLSDIAWDGATLKFAVRLAPGAYGADAMLPVRFQGRRLASVSCGRGRADLAVDTIKGIDMVFFAARTGRCEARYVDAAAVRASAAPRSAGA